MGYLSLSSQKLIHQLLRIVLGTTNTHVIHLKMEKTQNMGPHYTNGKSTTELSLLWTTLSFAVLVKILGTALLIVLHPLALMLFAKLATIGRPDQFHSFIFPTFF